MCAERGDLERDTEVLFSLPLDGGGSLHAPIRLQKALLLANTLDFAASGAAVCWGMDDRTRCSWIQIDLDS